MVACWLEPYATLQWQACQPEVLACNLDDAFTLISSTLGNVKAAAHALPSVTGAVTGAEHQLGRLEQPGWFAMHGTCAGAIPLLSDAIVGPVSHSAVPSCSSNESRQQHSFFSRLVTRPVGPIRPTDGHRLLDSDPAGTKGWHRIPARHRQYTLSAWKQAI